jgi:hypothetical protein
VCVCVREREREGEKTPLYKRVICSDEFRCIRIRRPKTDNRTRDKLFSSRSTCSNVFMRFRPKVFSRWTSFFFLSSSTSFQLHLRKHSNNSKLRFSIVDISALVFAIVFPPIDDIFAQ